MERALPALGFEGVHDVRVGRLVELETDDPSELDALCEKLLANPLIEDFEVELDAVIGRHPVPGLLRRARCAGRGASGRRGARSSGTRRRDLAASTAVVVPGGFSYGDYLRAGAIARFSPAMEAVAASRPRAAPVLGICNGFQVLCEAGLLPGALLPNEGLRFICRQVELVRGLEGHSAGIERATLSIPVKHGGPLLRAG